LAPVFDRIGDENDFLLNLLERSSAACDKCRLNIETSLESLNRLNRRKDDLDVLVKPLSDSGESDMTGINVKMASPSAGLDTDELKNKKVCDF
jgi:hypothetical protein